MFLAGLEAGINATARLLALRLDARNDLDDDMWQAAIMLWELYNTFLTNVEQLRWFGQSTNQLLPTFKPGARPPDVPNVKAMGKLAFRSQVSTTPSAFHLPTCQKMSS